MNLSIYMKGNYEEIPALNAAKKQSQSTRSAYCVLSTARTELKKQSQFYCRGAGFYGISGAWYKPTLAIVGHTRESKILIRTFSAVTAGNRQILL